MKKFLDCFCIFDVSEKIGLIVAFRGSAVADLRGQPEKVPAAFRGDPPLCRAHEIAFLNEVRLVHIFNSSGFLPDGDSQRVHHYAYPEP